MTDCLVVTTSVPDTAIAKILAHKLLKEKLAACISITPPMTSVYVWQGEIREEQEYLLVIKTQTSHYDRVARLLRTEHPYELPEIIATDITHGLPEYLGWIKESTQE
jgi:periplasmic divalent cation tolerance protein